MLGWLNLLGFEVACPFSGTLQPPLELVSAIKLCWRERKYELALAKFRILAEDCLLKIYCWLLHCSLDNDDFNIINFAFINISPFIYRQTLIFTQISFIVGKLVTVAWLIMLVVRGVTIHKAVLWLELSLRSFLMDNVHIWLRGNWKIFVSTLGFKN